MSVHSTYETLRHLADSWGLFVLFAMWAGFGLWAFRPGAREHQEKAANSIFKDNDDGE